MKPSHYNLKSPRKTKPLSKKAKRKLSLATARVDSWNLGYSWSPESLWLELGLADTYRNTVN